MSHKPLFLQNNLSMPHFVNKKFGLFILIAVFGIALTAPVAYAENQCAGATPAADSACSAVTGNTICCVVPGRDNSCETASTCQALQEAAPTAPQPTTQCTGATPVVCRVGSTQFCEETPQSCTSSSIGAQVVSGGGTQPSQPSPTPTQPTTVTPTVTEPGSTAPTGQGVLVNPLRAGNIPDLLRIVLQGLIQIGTIILVLALVWVGFLFVVAQGNEEKNTRRAWSAYVDSHRRVGTSWSTGYCNPYSSNR